jgi:hypothetical protein
MNPSGQQEAFGSAGTPAGTGPAGFSSKKWIIIAAISVAVIVIAAATWWLYDDSRRETTQEIAPGQTLVSAREGRIVSRFPGELILENSPEVLSSYRIEYANDNISLPFVRYVSGMSFAENVELFANYFIDNEWEMLRVGDVEEAPATFFYGAKDNSEVNVIVSEADDRVEVSISYALAN